MLKKPQQLAFYASLIIFIHFVALMLISYFEIAHQSINILAELLTIPFLIIDVLIGLHVIRQIYLKRYTRIQLYTLIFFLATMLLIVSGTILEW